MSESGVYSSDISQLRQLGSWIDAVLIGAANAPTPTFRAACDALGKVLDLAQTVPVRDLQGLMFSELLDEYLPGRGEAVDGVRRDLAKYAIGPSSNTLLEILARSLERERVEATNRMRSPR
jgi:hypothetical protein